MSFLGGFAGALSDDIKDQRKSALELKMQSQLVEHQMAIQDQYKQIQMNREAMPEDKALNLFSALGATPEQIAEMKGKMGALSPAVFEKMAGSFGALAVNSAKLAARPPRNKVTFRPTENGTMKIVTDPQGNTVTNEYYSENVADVNRFHALAGEAGSAIIAIEQLQELHSKIITKPGWIQAMAQGGVNKAKAWAKSDADANVYKALVAPHMQKYTRYVSGNSRPSETLVLQEIEAAPTLGDTSGISYKKFDSLLGIIDRSLEKQREQLLPGRPGKKARASAVEEADGDRAALLEMIKAKNKPKKE